MAAVMRQAADIDDRAYCSDHEEMSRLKTENEILRELLMISRSSYGSKFLQSTDSQKQTTDTPSEGTLEKSDVAMQNSTEESDKESKDDDVSST